MAYVILNDSFYEGNPPAGLIALKYDSNNKSLTIIDGNNKQVIDNITNEPVNVPTKLSELTNDVGFLTNANINQQDLSDYAKKTDIPEVPTKTSDLTNDSGYLTSFTETDPIFAAQSGQFEQKEIAGQLLGNCYDVLLNRIKVLENRLIKLNASVNASNTISSNGGNLSQPENDIIINIEDPLSGVSDIKGASITIDQLNVDNGRINAVSSGDVTVSNLSTAGNLPTSTSNAQFSINTSESVEISNSKIGQTSRNAIEIGLNGTAPKSVLIDNVHFISILSNNAILIFNTGDNAVITISNCTFDKCSNALRISNRDNVNLTVNLINCEFGDWDTIPEYAGVVICEDYTSKSVAAEETANLFAPDKVTINFINCTHKGAKISFNDAAEIAGTKNVETQLVYVYYDQKGYIDYDIDRYPTITCK